MKYNQDKNKIEKLTDEVNSLTEQVNALSSKKSYIPGGINFINKNVKYETDWYPFSYHYHPASTDLDGTYPPWLNWEQLIINISLDGQVSLNYSHELEDFPTRPFCIVNCILQVPEELSTYVKLNIFFKTTSEAESFISSDSYMNATHSVILPRIVDNGIAEQMGNPADLSSCIPVLCDFDNNLYHYRYSMTGFEVTSGNWQTYFFRGIPHDEFTVNFAYPTWVKVVISINSPYKYDETI